MYWIIKKRQTLSTASSCLTHPIDETIAKLPDGDIFDNEEIYLDHIDVTETEVADLIKNIDRLGMA